MTDRSNESPGILVVGHGSPRPQANEGFIALVERIARRLPGAAVLPTFFSIARPNIDDQVAALAARGVGRILLMPYFLYTGQHVAKDIPALLARCREQHPRIAIELLPTLEGEPALEDVVVERLASFVPNSQPLPVGGAAIEQRSFEIIDAQLAGGDLPADPAERAIVRRVVHATADLSFARSMRIHPRAVQRGLEALAGGKAIVCDVKMLAAGLTKVRNEVICAIGEPEVARLAGERGCTRAAAAMEFLAPRLAGAIVAVGNAPTALWKLMEMASASGPRPALVVGLPVGFVGARESKLALIGSGLCYVSNVTPRGGSPAAAAAINALASMK